MTQLQRTHPDDLVDDLANVLMHMVVGWEKIIGHDLAKHPEVERVMARYRQDKAVRETVDAR